MKKENELLFIGGLPRSGTSLMRAVISSHPQVALFYEDLPLWRRYYRNYKNKDLSKRKNQDNLVNEILSHRIVKRSDINLDKDKIIDNLQLEGVTWSTVFYFILKEYARHYDASIFGLKMPLNEFYADVIFHHFPQSKMIHMVRDPRDVALSFMNAGIGKSQYSLLNHILLWKKSFKISRRNQNIYKDKYKIVFYKDFVSEPDIIVKGICDFIGVDFQEEMLEMPNVEKWKGQNSSFNDAKPVNKKIHRGSIGRYKTRLDKRYIWLYQLFLKKELKNLGFEITKVRLTIFDFIYALLLLIFSGLKLLWINFTKLLAQLIRGTIFYKLFKWLQKKLNIPDYL